MSTNPVSGPSSTVSGPSSLPHLTWALRRYGWLLALAVLLGIGAGAAAHTAQKPVYEAEALVVAQQLSLNPEALPGYASAVFSSGAVARAVAGEPGLDVTPETLVPDKLEVLTAPDSVAIQVVARDAAPEVASRLANAAAAAFVIELNRAGPGVGTFALQDRAGIPVEPVTGVVTLPVAIAAGAVAGALLGAGLIALMLLVRRPVISATDAERLVGLPVFGLVELPRLKSSQFPGPRGVPGIAGVTRNVLEAAPTALLLTAPSDVAPARRRIAVMLAISLQPFRAVTTRMIPAMEEAVRQHQRAAGVHRAAGRGEEHRPRHDASLLLVDGAEPLDVMEYQDYSRCTLLVVHQGTTSQRLRRLVSDYLEGELDGVVLYRTGRRRARDVASNEKAATQGRRRTADRADAQPLVETPGH